MHSASAGPVALEQVADLMSPFLAMVPPGQVTEISFSPGLQVKSQLLLWPQPSWRSACRPLGRPRRGHGGTDRSGLAFDALRPLRAGIAFRSGWPLRAVETAGQRQCRGDGDDCQ